MQMLVFIKQNGFKTIMLWYVNTGGNLKLSAFIIFFSFFAREILAGEYVWVKLNARQSQGNVFIFKNKDLLRLSGYTGREVSPHYSLLTHTPRVPECILQLRIFFNSC